jgi:polar amino acid transport system substrate-binding protein
MMTSRHLFKSLAVAAALGLALTGCGSSGKKTDGSSAGSVDTVSAGTLTVCSDVPYPPFEDFDKSAATGYKGFDVDVISAVAKRLKLKLAIIDSDFDALQSGLLFNSRKCDLGASAMTVTAERKKHILFSDGYYDSEQSLLVATGSPIKSISDLDGVKVGVQKGTTGETYTHENAPKAEAIQYSDDGKMYTALKAGQIDAILQDLPVNLDHQKDPKQAGKWTVVQTFKTDEQYAFGAKKDSTALIAAVNKALAAMKSDGSYKTIYDKYFTVS